MQVSDEIFKFGKFLKINTATVYGVQSYSRQLKHIENSSVIVATPGRFLDLLRDGKIEIAPKYVDRNGGYTSIIKTRIRKGDATPMAFISFI